jgi:hypothetical protein
MESGGGDGGKRGSVGCCGSLAVRATVGTWGLRLESEGTGRGRRASVGCCSDGRGLRLRIAAAEARIAATAWTWTRGGRRQNMAHRL